MKWDTINALHSQWYDDVIRRVPCQASVLLHHSDHDGDRELAVPHGDAVRHLPVHLKHVCVLPTQPTALAELDTTQLVVQRLLRQGNSTTLNVRRMNSTGDQL